MISRRFALVSAVLLGALTSQAQAVSLLPGGNVPTPGSTPVPVGTQVGTAFSTAISFGGDFIATLTTQAVSNATGVGFLYQVTNNALSNTDIISAVEVNFNTFTTDVDYTNSDPDAAGLLFVDGTVATSSASRSSTPGTSITFSFGTGIAKNQASEVFFVQTNASSFIASGVVLSGKSGDSAVARSLGPIGSPVAVPEPSMLAMAFTALPVFGLAGVIRRRRKSVSEIG